MHEYVYIYACVHSLVCVHACVHALVHSHLIYSYIRVLTLYPLQVLTTALQGLHCAQGGRLYRNLHRGNYRPWFDRSSHTRGACSRSTQVCRSLYFILLCWCWVFILNLRVRESQFNRLSVAKTYADTTPLHLGCRSAPILLYLTDGLESSPPRLRRGAVIAWWRPHTLMMAPGRNSTKTRFQERAWDAVD